MIKKLRRRFLVITMISVILVVGLLIGFINITNFIQVDQDNDFHIRMLTDINTFEKEFLDVKPPEHIKENVDLSKQTDPRTSPETLYMSRYFTVTYDENDEIVEVNLDSIAAINYEEAVLLAEEVNESGKEEGYKSTYKYLVVESQSGTKIIFLDCSRTLWNVRQFFLTSLWISIGGTIMIFLLVLFFSKRAVAPVAESYEKQKRFITDASHELKTPITVIGANTEIVEMEHGESEWTKSTKHQIDRLSKLTENLVLLSRMDEEQQEELREKINLSEMVRTEFEEFRAAGMMVNKVFTMDIEDGIILKGNSEKIKKLCTILGENALKYASDNSEIRITVKKEGKNIEFSTENAVEGIEKGNYNHLFERFVRAETSRNSKTGGHGIGLSVAQAIVLSHKGKISAFSKNGKTLVIQMIFT